MIRFEYQSLSLRQIEGKLAESVPFERVGVPSNELRNSRRRNKIVKPIPEFSRTIRSKLFLCDGPLFTQLAELFIVEMDIQSISQ